MHKLSEYPAAIRALVIIMLIISFIFFLIIAEDFLVPIFLAILFSLFLLPLAEKLESWGIHRILANLILIILSIALLAGVIFLLSRLVISFTNDLPSTKNQITSNIKEFQKIIFSTFGISAERQDRLINTQISQILSTSGKTLQKVFSATTNTILKFALLPIYTFLMLFYRDKFKKFMYMAVPNRLKTPATIIINRISLVTPKYLLGLVIVMLILSVLNSAGFLIVGVKHAIFFGVLAAIINLIPYLGTIIGYGVVLLFVLVTQDLGTAFGVIICFSIIQFTENNILTPNITGSQVEINPLVIIMGIIVGGMIWGLPGMFITIPFLAMLKIAFENIESLKPYAFLMSTKGAEEHSLNYKRILKWIKDLFSRNNEKEHPQNHMENYKEGS